MTSVLIDRNHRGRIQTTNGVPDSVTKGNIAIDDLTGKLYTRRSILTDWAVSGGTDGIRHPGNGTELKEFLEDSQAGTIILDSTIYTMPAGSITITAPKTIIGTGFSYINLPGATTSDKLILSYARNVFFHNVVFTRTYVAAVYPTELIYVYNSNRCKFYNCIFGDDEFAMDGGNIIYFYQSQGCAVEECEFIIPTNGPVSLIDGYKSSRLSINRNYGALLVCSASVFLDTCREVEIIGNRFYNSALVRSSIQVRLDGDCSKTHIEDNTLINDNASGEMTTYSTLLLNCGTLCRDVNVINNTIYFNQAEDNNPGDGGSVVTLYGREINFSGNKVWAQYVGYSDSVYSRPVPLSHVVFAIGDYITIANNSINAELCRCAVYVDSSSFSAERGFGHRIIGNNIIGYDMETPYDEPRLDGTGVYMGDNFSSGTPQGWVVANNTFAGGTNSTAVRGCPINCWPVSWPPTIGECAENMVIIGNNMYTGLWGGTTYGISIATIGFSVITGNNGTPTYPPHDKSIDLTEVGLSGNSSNNYGTGNTDVIGTSDIND